MPLKLSKLESLLSMHHLTILCLYTLQSVVVCVKVFCLLNGISFIITIDKEFQLGVDPFVTENIMVLEKIEFKDGESTVERFTTSPSDKEVKDMYDINLDKEYEDSQVDVEANMRQKYKQKILLRDASSGGDALLKDCMRQLKRLSLSFDHLKYSICITENQIMTIAYNSEKMQSFLLKPSSSANGRRRVFILVSLEYFYEVPEDVIEDIKHIKHALFQILDENAAKAREKLFAMLSKFDVVGQVIHALGEEKASLTNYLEQYKNFLTDLMVKEKALDGKLDNLHEELANLRINDTSYVHQKQDLQDQKEKILRLKQQILRNILETESTNDNLYLKGDKCDFDNIVLVDAILKNIKENEKELQKK